MTVPEVMREHHAHCVQYQVRLRILARDEGAAPITPGIRLEPDMAGLLDTEDGRERPRPFIERRKARFTGR